MTQDREELKRLQRDLAPYRDKTVGSIRIDIREINTLLSDLEAMQEAASEGLICAEADLEDALNLCSEHGDDPSTDPMVKVFRDRRDLIAAALARQALSKEPEA